MYSALPSGKEWEWIKKFREDMEKRNEVCKKIFSAETKDVEFNNDINNLSEKLKDLPPPTKLREDPLWRRLRTEREEDLTLKRKQMYNNCVKISEGIINKYTESNNDNSIYSVLDKSITPVKLLSYVNNQKKLCSNNLLSIIKDFTTEDEEFKRKMDYYYNVLSEFKTTLDSFDTIELSRYSENIIIANCNLINFKLWNLLEYGYKIPLGKNNLKKTKDGSLYVGASSVFNKIKDKKGG